MLTTVHRWLLIDALMHSAGCTIEDTRTNTVKIPRASRGRRAHPTMRNAYAGKDIKGEHKTT